MAAAMEIDEESNFNANDKSGHKKRFEVKKVQINLKLFQRYKINFTIFKKI